ncbi:MAG TPA: hypothetical protein PKH65_00450 [Bacteroidia bacterium]|nr:hypothetical protein [Bacteroidia bacterium]HNT79122.1 hypothetical protein [Bacteroidia bacterium]
MKEHHSGIGITNNGVFDLLEFEQKSIRTTIELNDRFSDTQIEQLKDFTNLKITYSMRQQLILPHEKGNAVAEKQAKMPIEIKHAPLFGTASVKLIAIENRCIVVENFKVLHGIPIIHIEPFMMESHD